MLHTNAAHELERTAMAIELNWSRRDDEVDVCASSCGMVFQGSQEWFAEMVFHDSRVFQQRVFEM